MIYIWIMLSNYTQSGSFGGVTVVVPYALLLALEFFMCTISLAWRVQTDLILLGYNIGAWVFKRFKNDWWILIKTSKVIKCHKHWLQTNPQHSEEAPQNTDSHNTI